MPAIEFTYTTIDGDEYEVVAEFDPPDFETGITAPRITNISVSHRGLPVYLSKIHEDLIIDRAVTLLREPPSE